MIGGTSDKLLEELQILLCRIPDVHQFADNLHQNLKSSKFRINMSVTLLIVGEQNEPPCAQVCVNLRTYMQKYKHIQVSLSLSMCMWRSLLLI